MSEVPQKSPEIRPPTRALATVSTAPSVVRTPLRPAVAADSPEIITPRRILDAVRFWWKWALPAGVVLGALGSSLVYALFDPTYQASAWLRIEDHTPYLAFEPGPGAEQSKGFVATQIELLRSPMVLGPVVATPEARAIPEMHRDDPMEWLRGKIDVKAVGDSELYIVSFACSRPDAAAFTVNAVLDSYFQLRTAEQGKRVERVVQILELERDSRASEVDSLRKNVREMAKQVTGTDPFQATPEMGSTAAKPLAELATRLIAAEVDETVLRAKLRVLESASTRQPVAVSNSLIEKSVAASPSVIAATEALAQQRSNLGAMEAQATRGKADPTYQRAAQRLAQDEKALEDLKQTLRANAKQHYATETVGIREEGVAALRSEAENLRVAKELLKERYEAELKSVKQSTGDSVSLKFKQDELARAEGVLDLIAQRLVMLRTEKGAPPRVWQMQRAQVPLAPVQPVPYAKLLFAIVAGLVAPFGLAILKEHLTARISDAAFVERHGHLTVLGEITRLPTRNPRATSPARAEEHALRVFQESVEALRTSLMLGSHSGSLRVLAITSAAVKEGKTSVAVQLAVSIARASGGRVLVIDGDLRDPSVHSMFQLSREPGLTNVLAEGYPLRKAIKSTPMEGVDALPAGLLRGNPHKLMENGRWELLLKEIPPDYQHVIIDTPPVLAASEALVLARGADATIICAMRDVTCLPQLKKAAERMASAGAKIAGLVLNGIPASQYASRNGTYYPYLLD